MYGIEETLLKNGFTSTELSLSPYTIDSEENYRIEGDWYKIEIEPRLDDVEPKLANTYVYKSGDGLKKCYIECGLSSMKAFEIGELMYDKRPYELDVDNYEMSLKIAVGFAYRCNREALEFFSKMMPVFRLIYNDLEKSLMDHSEEYLEKLIHEKNELTKKLMPK